MEVGDLLALGKGDSVWLYVVTGWDMGTQQLFVKGFKDGFLVSTFPFRPPSAIDMQPWVHKVLHEYEELDDLNKEIMRKVFSNEEFKRLYLSA
jgi:hypothetical protein